MQFKSRKTGEVLYVADSQAKTIRHMVMSGRYEVMGDAEWNEADHPRGENGQFTGGSGGSSTSKQEVEHSLERVNKNIAWFEKNRPPQEKAATHRRHLRELYEARDTLKAQLSEKESEQDRKNAAEKERHSRMSEGTPVKVKGRIQGEGETGEIIQTSETSDFVVVKMSNGEKRSYHKSNLEEHEEDK